MHGSCRCCSGAAFHPEGTVRPPELSPFNPMAGSSRQGRGALARDATSPWPATVVLSHQFMDKRYLLNVPRLPRRMLMATVAVVVPCVLVIVVAIAVIGLFVIR